MEWAADLSLERDTEAVTLVQQITNEDMDLVVVHEVALADRELGVIGATSHAAGGLVEHDGSKDQKKVLVKVSIVNEVVAWLSDIKGNNSFALNNITDGSIGVALRHSLEQWVVID